jgi:hypothetical protein
MCHCEQSEGRFDPRPPHQVRFAPRNDYFLKSFTIVATEKLCQLITPIFNKRLHRLITLRFHNLFNQCNLT